MNEFINIIIDMNNIDICVIAYIYFTRIGIDLLEAHIPYYMLWLGPCCNEITTLLFFVFTGYSFRPSLMNPYLSVPTEDDEHDESIRKVVENMDKYESSTTQENGNNNQYLELQHTRKFNINNENEENYAADSEYGLNNK